MYGQVVDPEKLVLYLLGTKKLTDKFGQGVVRHLYCICQLKRRMKQKFRGTRGKKKQPASLER